MELLPENREVLDGYRRSRPEALERVYRAYVPDVAAFLRQGFSFSSQGRHLRFTGYHNPDDLQDSLQETFLLAFGESARKGYNGLSSFKSYLLGIARNVVLGRFRKDVSRLRCFQTAEAIPGRDAGVMLQELGLATISPSPEELAESREVKRLVADFVSGLSEEQRRVVQLYFLDRMSQEATAEALTVDRNRIRKQIRVIRKMLWRRIRREGLDHALPLSLRGLEVKP
jgi:RNA polymerase sigma factor (sigma-70 family)